MGMYDTVNVLAENDFGIPVGEYQTQSLNCSLDTYTLCADGRLVLTEYFGHHDWAAKTSAGVPHTPTVVTGINGIMCVYGDIVVGDGSDETKWVELNVQFTDGVVAAVLPDHEDIDDDIVFDNVAWEDLNSPQKYPPEMVTRIQNQIYENNAKLGNDGASPFNVLLQDWTVAVLEALSLEDIQYLAVQHGFNLISRDDLMRDNDLECPLCGYEGMIFTKEEKLQKINTMLEDYAPQFPNRTLVTHSAESLTPIPEGYKPISSEEVLPEIPQIDLGLPEGTIPLYRYMTDHQVQNSTQILVEVLKYLSQGISPRTDLVSDAFRRWVGTFKDVYDVIEEFPKRDGEYMHREHGQRIINHFLVVWTAIPQQDLNDEANIVLDGFKALLIENGFKADLTIQE